MKCILSTILCLVTSLPLMSQSKEVTQFWYQANIYYRMTSATRLYGLFEIDRDLLVGSNTLNVGGFLDVGIRPSLRAMLEDIDSAYKADALQYVILRSGVMYVSALNASQPTNEWRGVLDLTPRWILPLGIRLNWRNRNEFRWINGDFSFRFRSRLWFGLPISVVESQTLTPYISSEIFYDTRFDRFSRSTSQLGISYGFVTWSSFDVLAVYQRDWIRTGATTLALQFMVAVHF